jgi:hypothetical protein
VDNLNIKPLYCTIDYMKKYNTAIVDIDDTLVSGFWHDEAMTPNMAVVNFVKNNIENVIIVTGRQDTMRDATVTLLESLGIKYDALLMNPEHYDKSDEFKDGIAKMLQGKIELAIDDNPDVRAIYESYGIKSIDPVDLTNDILWSSQVSFEE